MKSRAILFTAMAATSIATCAQIMTVNASKVIAHIEPLIYGAGAEDVNHEIYGGLYDQKIFGEGFEESAEVHLAGFSTYDDPWYALNGIANIETDAYGSLVYDKQHLSKGSAEVEIKMEDGNTIAGFIIHTSDISDGENSFNGYEIALNTYVKKVFIAKHRQDWQLITDIETAMNPSGQWNKLRVDFDGGNLRVYLNDKLVRQYNDIHNPLTNGKIGIRSYAGSSMFRNLKINGKKIEFKGEPPYVSSMWKAVGSGQYKHDDKNAFTGKYAQQITGKTGDGIANMGLNGWGIGIEKGKKLNVALYLKGDAGQVRFSLQSSNGQKEYASATVTGIGKEWKKFETTLTPDQTDKAGRFVLQLGANGKLWVDQVLLCTDAYPFRADLTEAFKNEHLTFLRYGGTMVNAKEYMTKNMIGSRLEREPYKGHWYKQATNGFAIPEFVEFARKIGAEPTFAINIEDNPTDVLALLREIEPYNLKYIEIGNEECISSSSRKIYEHYVERYLVLYNAIHAVYPDLKFINSAWWRKKHLDTMEYVFRSLDGRCDFWDFHPWTELPEEAIEAEKDIALMQSQFLKWNPQTTMRCAILEENGNTHDMARALAHAVMLNNVRRANGFVPLDSPANALQPNEQNDNGWDQGQIFFSPSQVWMQPPYYAQQMAATNHQPLLVESKCDLSNLDYTATRSLDGKTLVLHIVNYDNSGRSLSLNLNGFGEIGSIKTYSLAGNDEGENSPERPERFVPVVATMTPGSNLHLEGYSYTVVVIETK